MWSVNVLSRLCPLRPCSFQLSTAVLKFLHNISRSLLCYQYGYQASAVSENLCTQEGYRCVSNAYHSGKRGFTSSSSGRALQGRLKSIHSAGSVSIKRWPLVKADKVDHVFLPKWEITFAGTNSWVIVLLTEVKRLSSIHSEKSEFRADRLPQEGSSSPLDALLSGCHGHSSLPCLKCCHAPGDPQKSGVMLHGVVALNWTKLPGLTPDCSVLL